MLLGARSGAVGAEVTSTSASSTGPTGAATSIPRVRAHLRRSRGARDRRGGTLSVAAATVPGMTTGHAPRVIFARDDAAGLELRGEGVDERVPWGAVPGRLRDLEGARPRWVWADAGRSYPHLLDLGVRLEQCRDLRMVHTLLARSERCSLVDDPSWRRRDEPSDEGVPSLLDLPGAADSPSVDAMAAEYERQEAAIAAAPDVDGRAGVAPRLRLLAAAESAGALVAAELRYVGMPWDVAEHDRLLVDLLGARSSGRPARMEELAAVIREALGRPDLNPDSQPALLAALRRAGLDVASTSKWELRGIEHPVVEPLLTYKKLSRLYSANGWAWASRWVSCGRFRPDYVPSAVVTGRWATNGGGALQLPKEVRSAVRVGSDRRLVVADARQLEPRVLAGMSGDRAMAAAARGADLYAGLVAQGVVATRDEAKYAMLGAMYGATQGAGGALVPRLRQAYPAAMRLVDEAARAGEHGDVVTTWLGRSSVAPVWADRIGTEEPLTDAERARTRDWGRFTRNFVVQGTAAEWALCWLAGLRNELARLGGPEDARLVYFLHDEVVVECRAELADQVGELVGTAADEAGRLLFGDAVDFPVELATVTDYGQAKG